MSGGSVLVLLGEKSGRGAWLVMFGVGSNLRLILEGNQELAGASVGRE